MDRRSPAQRERQLLDAQLAWRVGKQTGQITNFENAALILYDLVEQNPDGRNLARALGDSHFENGLRDVDGDGGSLFHGLLLYGSRPVNPDDFGSQKPIKSGEESISSFERTRSAAVARIRKSGVCAPGKRWVPFGI